jgi:hypothetical protein
MVREIEVENLIIQKELLRTLERLNDTLREVNKNLSSYLDFKEIEYRDKHHV